VKGRDGGTVGVEHAIVQLGRIRSRIVWKQGVASRICGSQARRIVELGQTIERLDWKIILSPVLKHGSEIIIKRPILLGQDNDVI